MVTDSPRATRTAPNDAAVMPFPSEETTPPVTKIKRVILIPSFSVNRASTKMGLKANIELTPAQ